MSVDFRLHCSLTLLRKRRLKLVSPPDLAGVAAGSLVAPPDDWTGGNRLAANGEGIATWVASAIGSGAFSAIGARALEESDVCRVLISSEARILDEALAAPWEFLEHSAIDRPAGERLSVVRLVPSQRPDDPPRHLVQLRLLGLWADPQGDLPDLPAHIAELTEFAEDRPDQLRARFIELSSPEEARNAAISFSPHVVYYIGHASQPGHGKQVQLHIGRRGAPSFLTMPGFADLLDELGEPRLIVVNACESFSGADLNPFVGAALQCVPRFDAAIAMQAKMPVASATRFARRLVERLAQGKGLAEAMKDARVAIAQDRELYSPISRFLPVLIQATERDMLFDVAVDEQLLARLQKSLAVRLERISAMPRQVHGDLARALAGQSTAVSFVWGPAGCGKSTSIRQAIGGLLALDGIRQGDRPLYFSARDLLPVEDPDGEVRQLLVAFAKEFGSITAPLARALDKTLTASAADHIAALAAWMDEQHASGLRIVAVLDDVRGALARLLAQSAGVFASGHLMLCTRGAPPAGIGATSIPMTKMTPAEIEAAAPALDPAVVAAMHRDSNGLPYMVSAALQAARGATVDALDKELDKLPQDSRDLIVALAAAETALPEAALAGMGFDRDDITALEDALLVIRTDDSHLSVPRMVRDAIVRRLAPPDAFETRQHLFNDLMTLTEGASGSVAGHALRTQAASEAFRQAMHLMTLADEEDRQVILDAAKDAAETLDALYLESGLDQPEMAQAIWDRYRGAAADAGVAVEPRVGLRYARCLARRGKLERALEVVSGIELIAGGTEVELQQLMLHAEVLKGLGRKGSRAERIRLLETACKLVDELMASGGLERARGLRYAGDIEQSLGNALGYGGDSRPQDAISHARRAADIFESLGDVRQFRARAEAVEIARYNGLLDPAARADAIRMLRAQAETLLERSEHYDAAHHLYELGRLATEPGERVKWFRICFQRTRVEPIRWHAGIKWRIAAVEGNLMTLEEALPLLEECLQRLEQSQQWAWSRRVTRDALCFLASRFADKDPAAERAFLERAWHVIQAIRARGESARDCEIREQVARDLQKHEGSAP